MRGRLRSRAEISSKVICVHVAVQEHDLKEEHAGCPDTGRTAEPWQDRLGHHRLAQEQQRRTQKNGRGVEHQTGLSGSSIDTSKPGLIFCARNRPWWTLTARWAMARPNPTPPVALSLETSTRKNGVKIFGSNSSGTPGP